MLKSIVPIISLLLALLGTSWTSPCNVPKHCKYVQSPTEGLQVKCSDQLNEYKLYLKRRNAKQKVFPKTVPKLTCKPLDNITSILMPYQMYTDITHKLFTHSMKSLVTLDISHNFLRRLDPGQFLSHPNTMKQEPDEIFSSLLELDASVNLIRHIAPKTFWYMPKLKTLKLTENALTSLPDEVFQKSEHLVTLLLGSLDLHKIGPTTFKGLRHVKHFTLDNNVALTRISHRAFIYMEKLEKFSWKMVQLHSKDLLKLIIPIRRLKYINFESDRYKCTMCNFLEFQIKMLRVWDTKWKTRKGLHGIKHCSLKHYQKCGIKHAARLLTTSPPPTTTVTSKPRRRTPPVVRTLPPRRKSKPQVNKRLKKFRIRKPKHRRKLIPRKKTTTTRQTETTRETTEPTTTTTTPIATTKPPKITTLKSEEKTEASSKSTTTSEAEKGKEETEEGKTTTQTTGTTTVLTTKKSNESEVVLIKTTTPTTTTPKPTTTEEPKKKYPPMKELVAPKIRGNHIVIKRHRYKITSHETMLKILDYGVMLRDKIRKIKDQHKLNFYLHVFTERMDLFIKSFLVKEVEEREKENIHKEKAFKKKMKELERKKLQKEKEEAKKKKKLEEAERKANATGKPPALKLVDKEIKEEKKDRRAMFIVIISVCSAFAIIFVCVAVLLAYRVTWGKEVLKDPSTSGCLRCLLMSVSCDCCRQQKDYDELGGGGEVVAKKKSKKGLFSRKKKSKSREALVGDEELLLDADEEGENDEIMNEGEPLCKSIDDLRSPKGSVAGISSRHSRASMKNRQSGSNILLEGSNSRIARLEGSGSRISRQLESSSSRIARQLEGSGSQISRQLEGSGSQISRQLEGSGSQTGRPSYASLGETSRERLANFDKSPRTYGLHQPGVCKCDKCTMVKEEMRESIKRTKGKDFRSSMLRRRQSAASGSESNTDNEENAELVAKRSSVE